MVKKECISLGDITSRITISLLSFSAFLMVLSVSVKNDAYLTTVVPSFSDHRCQSNSKAMECFDKGSSFFKGTFLTKAVQVNNNIMSMWEVSDHFYLLVGTAYSSSLPSCELTFFLK